MPPNRVPKNQQHRFKVACASCGDIELGSAELEVEVRTADGSGIYSFDCPRCGHASVHPAAPRVVELLLSTGVAARGRRSAGAPASGSHRPWHGPLDEDEIADFVDRLNQDDTWLAELLG